MLVQAYYYVYMMSNYTNTVVYIGVTGNLLIRVWQHKNKVKEGSFTAKYACKKLVYFEMYDNIELAIHREKQLKNWKREWKNDLITQHNPDMNDLAATWYFDPDWNWIKRSKKQ